MTVTCYMDFGFVAWIEIDFGELIGHKLWIKSLVWKKWSWDCKTTIMKGKQILSITPTVEEK